MKDPLEGSGLAFEVWQYIEAYDEHVLCAAFLLGSDRDLYIDAIQRIYPLTEVEPRDYGWRTKTHVQ